jgi:hypothetical protein
MMAWFKWHGISLPGKEKLLNIGMICNKRATSACDSNSENYSWTLNIYSVLQYVRQSIYHCYLK